MADSKLSYLPVVVKNNKQSAGGLISPGESGGCECTKRLSVTIRQSN